MDKYCNTNNKSGLSYEYYYGDCEYESVFRER